MIGNQLKRGVFGLVANGKVTMKSKRSIGWMDVYPTLFPHGSSGGPTDKNKNVKNKKPQ